MTDPEYIDPNHVRPGPIRQESLPLRLLELIGAVYGLIGPYLNTTLEQFEIGFMRDMDPESEVDVWCSIVAAWLAYHEKYLDDEYQDHEAEKQLIRALLQISAGVEDVEALDVPVDVGRKLLECYDGLAQEGQGPL
jgi:hypothetical protein